MKKNWTLRAVAMAALLAGGAASAQAQGMGDWMDGRWMIGIGAQQISPHVSSGSLSAPSQGGTQIDVRKDTQPVVWVTRLLTDHWSVEVPITAGFKHEIVGAGTIAGVGKIGTVRALPVTVFAQYRFLEPQARIRPYAMLGATYAHFYGARGSATLNAVNPINPSGGTGLKVDSKFALSPGIGVTFAITDKMFADLQYVHTFLKTTAHLSSGQSISTKLDPDAFRIGVGMRF